MESWGSRVCVCVGGGDINSKMEQSQGQKCEVPLMFNDKENPPRPHPLTPNKYTWVCQSGNKEGIKKKNTESKGGYPMETRNTW